MRPTFAALILSSMLPSGLLAQERGAPEPTELELWLTHPGTRISRSEEVGRIDSTDARAVITALVIQNQKIESKQLRGVRIDLRDDSSRDRIYIDEGDLVYRKEELGPMACAATRMRSGEGAGRRVQGVARCAPSNTIPRTYCPGYYVSPDFEGFGLSIHTGHTYRFGSQPSTEFADALGRALEAFGIDDEIPAPPKISISAADVTEVVAAAVEKFPELASSRGIKAAQYVHPDTANSVWAIFWPHRRDGDFASALTVYCDVVGNVGEGWDCSRSEPRGYLSLAGQEQELVITGPLERDTAVALIEYAKLKIKDEPLYKEHDDGWFMQILPLARLGGDGYRVTWRVGDGIGIRFEILDAPPGADEHFVLGKVFTGDGSRC